jgi:hypothetical protein
MQQVVEKDKVLRLALAMLYTSFSAVQSKLTTALEKTDSSCSG